MSVYFSLFLRNWVNGRATVEQIEVAVEKGLITEEEAKMIKENEQNPL